MKVLQLSSTEEDDLSVTVLHSDSTTVLCVHVTSQACSAYTVGCECMHTCRCNIRRMWVAGAVDFLHCHTGWMRAHCIMPYELSLIDSHGFLQGTRRMTLTSLETLSRPCLLPEWYVFPLATFLPVHANVNDDLTGSFPGMLPKLAR